MRHSRRWPCGPNSRSERCVSGQAAMIVGLESKFPSALALTAREFDQIRKLAYDQFGLELRTGKEQLVFARLAKIIRSLNFGSFQEYYEFLVADRSGEALTG